MGVMAGALEAILAPPPSPADKHPTPAEKKPPLEEDGPVSPLIVASLDELAREIGEIAKALREPIRQERSWKARAAAMRRAKALLLGGASEHRGFADLVGTVLCEPLGMQLADLRSKCVKQACHLVCDLALQLGASFAGTAAHLLPQLLRLLRGASAAVISDSADRAVRALLCHSRSALLLPPLISGAAPPSAAALRCRQLSHTHCTPRVSNPNPNPICVS